MTYELTNWANIIGNVPSSYIGFFWVLVGLVAVFAVGRLISNMYWKARAEANARKAPMPQLSRKMREQLKREGIPTELRPYSQAYRGTAQRAVHRTGYWR